MRARPDTGSLGNLWSCLLHQSQMFCILAPFGAFVAAQSPPKGTSDPVTLEVVSLEIAGKTAVAQVRDKYLGMTFLDTLSFLEVDGNWTIYNKLFHVES